MSKIFWDLREAEESLRQFRLSCKQIETSHYNRVTKKGRNYHLTPFPASQRTAETSEVTKDVGNRFVTRQRALFRLIIKTNTLHTHTAEFAQKKTDIRWEPTSHVNKRITCPFTLQKISRNNLMTDSSKILCFV